MEDSCWGFKLPFDDKSPHESQQPRLVVPHVHSRPAHPAPVTPIVAPAHHSSITPTIHCTLNTASVVSHTGFRVAPPSRSATSSSRGGSIAPSSCGGPVSQSSCNVSVTPSSRGVSVAPTTLSGSTTGLPGTIVSSQMLQRTCVTPTGTYSTHGLEDVTHRSHMELLQPLPYTGMSSDDDDNDPCSEFVHDDIPSIQNQMASTNQSPDGLLIDKLSPDEDDRMAEMVLRDVSGVRNARRIPDDHDIDPALLVEESDFNRKCYVHISPGGRSKGELLCVNRFNTKDRADSTPSAHKDDTINQIEDVVYDHHQHNGFPHPPDPTLLCDVHHCHQSSNGKAQGCAHINKVAQQERAPA
ncbi:hypothetical protein JVU11DRAFT_10548 [Chiua virens]|nr:hypothetical protein JVU11DRAFT_10548 [Chiua virens]